MRVISGKAKGHRLKRVPGDSTRPITDRVKENLFNILGDWVVGTRWLELFAGTGQVGIEALSRGASQVVFVERAEAAVRTIGANLSITHLAEAAAVQRADAFKYLEHFAGRPFDVIYVAPPQYQGLGLKTLALLDAEPGRFLEENGMIVVQIDPKEFEARDWNRLGLFDRRKYGRTLLCFYEAGEPSSSAMAHSASGSP
ncbi:MAG: 16S rRNA (guanine(966)-N(2))-methyltransferase RsmD [Candidatus Promineifilaceae bacterium]